jgi:hypothetical protein
MTVKDRVSAGPATSIKRAASNLSGTFSLPTPEQGIRLIHAFVRIREDGVREAIIKFVEDLSKVQIDS